MIWPVKALLFTLNNILTKRDYTYSIDDFSDLILFVCIGYWIYKYLVWSEIEVDAEFITSKTEAYVFQVMERMNFRKSDDSDFKINIFLVVMSFFIWIRFLLML